MNGNSDFFSRLNVAGQLPSDINAAVVDLLGKGVLNYEQAMTVLRPTRLIGGALASLAAWGADAPKAAGTVVDVGGGDGYTGPVNAAGLTLANKAFIAANLGAFSNKYGQVFNGPIDFGSNMGTLATTKGDPLTPDGFDLAKWV